MSFGLSGPLKFECIWINFSLEKSAPSFQNPPAINSGHKHAVCRKTVFRCDEEKQRGEKSIFYRKIFNIFKVNCPNPECTYLASLANMMCKISRNDSALARGQFWVFKISKTYLALFGDKE